MILIIGLGNPGDKYCLNRHNLGFMGIDAFHKEYIFPQWSQKFKGLYAKKNIFGKDVILLKPQTYMNNSGKSVQSCQSFYKTDLDNILVIHDELELSLGEVKEKIGGSAKGHNGLRSIDSSIGQNYHRLRCGIDRPSNQDVASYVLSNFSKVELEEVSFILGDIIQEIETFIKAKED